MASIQTQKYLSNTYDQGRVKKWVFNTFFKDFWSILRHLIALVVERETGSVAHVRGHSEHQRSPRSWSTRCNHPATRAACPLGIWTWKRLLPHSNAPNCAFSCVVVSFETYCQIVLLPFAVCLCSSLWYLLFYERCELHHHLSGPLLGLCTLHMVLFVSLQDKPLVFFAKFHTIYQPIHVQLFVPAVYVLCLTPFLCKCYSATRF